MTEGRIVRCRVTNRWGNPCGGEAVVPDADLKICTRHLAEAMRLISEVQQRTRDNARKTPGS